MSLLDRLRQYLSDDEPRRATGGSTSRPDSPLRERDGALGEDERAVERYRYLLRTAPPEAVEEVHAEAFASLTPQQRRLVFEELSQNASATERPATDDPRALARSATRSELRQPGFLERTLGSNGPAADVARGPGLGTMIGGSLLGTVAGVVIGSAIADTLLPGIGDLGSDFGDGVQDLGQDVSNGFDGTTGVDGDWGGGDLGGGGDFGGGDFGGGDFGGGDF